jgi:hypothetical protein
MKEHLLNDGDRAALQALVPLAGALGVGTIFALFFGGRRKAGLAVFELFAIVGGRDHGLSQHLVAAPKHGYHQR